MNDDRSDEKRRLLNEVFRTDSFDAFSGQLKERAWVELRRSRFMRRVALIAGTATAVAALITCGIFFQTSQRNKTAIQARASSANEGVVATAVQKAALDVTLTDEQLLALFPSDSCFIAEVEGRKMLVFRSPELRQKYLH